MEIFLCAMVHNRAHIFVIWFWRVWDLCIGTFIQCQFSYLLAMVVALYCVRISLTRFSKWFGLKRIKNRYRNLLCWWWSNRSRDYSSIESKCFDFCYRFGNKKNALDLTKWYEFRSWNWAAVVAVVVSSWISKHNTGESFYRHLMNSNSRPLHTNNAPESPLFSTNHTLDVHSFAWEWRNTTLNRVGTHITVAAAVAAAVCGFFFHSVSGYVLTVCVFVLSNFVCLNSIFHAIRAQLIPKSKSKIRTTGYTKAIHCLRLCLVWLLVFCIW